MQEINKNQLRERAKKLRDVDEERWSKVSEHNKYIMEEYFASMSNLSEATVVQYKSAMRIFFVWNEENNRGKEGIGKEIYEITKRDFMKYITFLTNHGLSSSAIKLKKSAVSSLCNFIELILSEEMEEYKTFRNFAEKLPSQVSSTVTYNKKVVTKTEYKKMMKVLEETEDYRGMCWLNLAFTTGARRGELRQFTRDILTTPYEVDKDGNELNFKMTGYIRGKGSGREGKKIRFMISRDSMKYIEKLIESEKGKHKSKYLFVAYYQNKTKMVSLSWGNDFCRRILSPIVGRRINPHLFKATAITNLIEAGHDIKAVSRHIGHHESVDLTLSRYNLQDDSEERNNLF